MNYYQPLELKSQDGHSGEWQMTCTNDNRTWPVGYCAERKCKHKSPQEASDCYRDYIKNEREGLFPGGFRDESERGEIYSSISSY